MVHPIQVQYQIQLKDLAIEYPLWVIWETLVDPNIVSPFQATCTLSRLDENIVTASIAPLNTETNNTVTTGISHTQALNEMESEFNLMDRTDAQKRSCTHNASSEEISPAHKQSKLDVEKLIHENRRLIESKNRMSTNITRMKHEMKVLEDVNSAMQTANDKLYEDNYKMSNEMKELQANLNKVLEESSLMREKITSFEKTLGLYESKLQNLTKQNTMLLHAVGENEEVINEIQRYEAELADEIGVSMDIRSQNTAGTKSNETQDIAGMREKKRHQQEREKINQYRGNQERYIIPQRQSPNNGLQRQRSVSINEAQNQVDGQTINRTNRKTTNIIDPTGKPIQYKELMAKVAEFVMGLVGITPPQNKTLTNVENNMKQSTETYSSILRKNNNQHVQEHRQPQTRKTQNDRSRSRNGRNRIASNADSQSSASNSVFSSLGIPNESSKVPENKRWIQRSINGLKTRKISKVVLRSRVKPGTVAVVPLLHQVRAAKIEKDKYGIINFSEMNDGSVAFTFKSLENQKLFIQELLNKNIDFIVPIDDDRRYETRIHRLPEGATIDEISRKIDVLIPNSLHEFNVEIFPYKNEKYRGENLAILKSTLKVYEALLRIPKITLDWRMCRVDTSPIPLKCKECGIMGHTKARCRESAIPESIRNTPNECTDCLVQNYINSKNKYYKVRDTKHQGNTNECKTYLAFTHCRLKGYVNQDNNGRVAVPASTGRDNAVTHPLSVHDSEMQSS